MRRNGIVSICAVSLGALVAVGGQAVFSQVSSSQPTSFQRLQYLCLDQRADHWSMHAPGLHFDGDAGDLAKRLSLKTGDAMQGGSSSRLVSEILNKLAADGWELTATNATALQYTQHVTYIFRRGR